MASLYYKYSALSRSRADFYIKKKTINIINEIKATEQYFAVMLFIMLYKVTPTVLSVGDIIKWDHLNERYRAVLFSGAVYYAVPGGCSFI